MLNKVLFFFTLSGVCLSTTVRIAQPVSFAFSTVGNERRNVVANTVSTTILTPLDPTSEADSPSSNTLPPILVTRKDHNHPALLAHHYRQPTQDPTTTEFATTPPTTSTTTTTTKRPPIKRIKKPKVHIRRLDIEDEKEKFAGKETVGKIRKKVKTKGVVIKERPEIIKKGEPGSEEPVRRRPKPPDAEAEYAATNTDPNTKKFRERSDEIAEDEHGNAEHEEPEDDRVSSETVESPVVAVVQPRKSPYENDDWSEDFDDERRPALEELITGDDNEEEERTNRARVQERSDRVLKRPKKNYLSEEKELLHPKSFSYSDNTDDDVIQGRRAVAPIAADQNPSASHGHKHKKKKHHKEKHEKGGGEEHHAHHHSSSGKKGDKGYKGYHKHEKAEKGHHDKESHKGSYADNKGKKKKHKEEKGHYGEHHKVEKGKKGAKYGESGEHKKGHSTKGEHNIHKKDEYMKKHEFYDEHHEGGDHEKHGGFHATHGHKKGGKHKSGHHKSGYHEGHHGKKGHHEKGGHHKDHKGHKEAEGHKEHHAHKSEYAKKGGHKEGKKWGYSKKKD